MQKTDVETTVEKHSWADERRRTYVSGMKDISNFGYLEPAGNPECEPPNNLLQQLAAGSETAFNTIYWEYSTHLLHFAMSFVESRESAEDLCADVFCMFWEMRDRFTNVKNVKGFLFISMRNICLNYLKSNASRASRQKEFVSRLEDTQWDLAGTTDVRSEYKKRIIKAIEGLPHQCKQVFTLSCFEGLKIDKIAARLGINRRTVINHKSKALRLLKDAILANQPGINIILVIYILHFPDLLQLI